MANSVQTEIESRADFFFPFLYRFNSSVYCLPADATFPLVRFKLPFSAVLRLFFVGGRLRLSCGRWRKVYGLIAVTVVPFAVFATLKRISFTYCDTLYLSYRR